jgi:RNA polymerase sigma-70 factor (ECF subfamily)
MSSFDVIASGNSEGERMEDALDTRAFALHGEIDCGDALLAEAARADAGAFGELYERYYPRVYRYVYHRVGNAADAEDITALVFMKALEALPGYRPRPNGFAPWLFRITRNAVVDYYRRRRKHSSLDVLEHHSDDHDPVGHVLGGERRAELQSLVENLSADQREVVLLRYAADLSFAEIASTMNKTDPAIRMLLHRGLRKLKAVLGDG